MKTKARRAERLEAGAVTRGPSPSSRPSASTPAGGSAAARARGKDSKGAGQALDAKIQKFLEYLCIGWHHTSALKAAKVDWRTVSRKLCEDPKLGEAYKAARTYQLEARSQRTEEEVDRRAIKGWEEPVFYKGDICGHIQRFSDRLLEMQAKGLRPELYSENIKIRAEHAGPQGGPIPLTYWPPEPKSVPEWERQAKKILSKSMKRPEGAKKKKGARR